MKAFFRFLSIFDLAGLGGGAGFSFFFFGFSSGGSSGSGEYSSGLGGGLC